MNTVLLGEVVTLDPDRPHAEAVVLEGDRITYVGDAQRARMGGRERPQIIDTKGGTIIPGLIDPHIHLLATAGQRRSVDCSAPNCSCVADLLAKLRAEAAARRPGEWIRAYGYDHELLAERRHPTRHELDSAAPHNPVRLDHKTGHALVFNSRACYELQLPLGNHDGVFYESRRTTSLSLDDLRDACGEVSDTLLRYGITRICDAGATNGLADVQLLSHWRREGVIKQDVAILVSEENATLTSDPDPDARGCIIGIKVMLTEHDLDETRLDALTELFAIRGDDAWIAIHVVELGALAILLDHLEALQDAGATIGRCRIEHLSLCPPEWIPRLLRLGVHVVTQPAFLAERQESYVRTVPVAQHDWLYPAARLLNASVPVAGSSDSPVGDPNPYLGMETAIDRGAHRGFAFGQPVPLSPRQALGLYTLGGAAVLGRAADVGRIVPGFRADLVVFEGDPLDSATGSLLGTLPSMVCVAGEITRLG